MTQTNERPRGLQSPRPLLRLMRHSKAPWLAYLIFFIVRLASTEFSVRLYDIAGQIFNGEIDNPAVVREFVLSNIAIVLLGLTVIPLTYVSIRFRGRVQKRSLKSLMHLPLVDIETLQPSSLVSRVSTDAAYVGNIFNYVTGFFQAAYALFAAARVLYKQNASLTLRLLPLILLSTLLAIVFGRFLFRIHFRLQQVESRLTAFLSERLGSLSWIKASQTEDEEWQKGQALNQRKYKAQLADVAYNTLYQGYQSFLTLLVTALVLILGAVQVANQQLEPGLLVSFLLLARTYPGNIQLVFTHLLSIIRIQGQTQVIAQIESRPAEKFKRDLSPLDHLGQAQLAAKNLSFAYPHASIDADPASVVAELNPSPILKNITCNLEPTDFIAIVGPSGSGKSTFLKLLERFYEPSEGELCLGDKNVASYHLDEWRQLSSYASQDAAVLPGSLRDNLLYGARQSLRDEDLYDLLKLVGLDDFVRQLPKQLDSELGDLGEKLSGGQRQRLALVRALAAQPKLLLIDEATANLDTEHERMIMEAIRKLRQGRRTVVVAHQLHTIQDADHILVLDQGELIAQGKHEALYQNCALYREMVDLQRIPCSAVTA